VRGGDAGGKCPELLEDSTSDGRRGRDDGDTGVAWPSRPGEPQHWWEPPRVVNSDNNRRGGNVAGTKAEPDSDREEDGLSGASGAVGDGADAAEFHEIKPEMGRDPARDSGGVDYAELCVSGDSRVDELRLLGNGVCVPTGERAFRTLIQRFF